MKSVIISKGKKQSVLLTADGQYVKTRTKKHFEEGKEVTYINSNKKMASIITMFVVMFAVLSFLVAYNVPAYSVSVDVNPSVEFYANIFNQVIDVNGLNEDGQFIANEVDYKNKELKDVLEEAITIIKDLGYIQEDYVIVIGVDGSEAQLAGVQEAVDTLIANQVLVPGIPKEQDEEEGEEEDKPEKDQGNQIIVGRITDEMREAAIAHEVSPGKILLITKANEAGAELEYEAATYLTVQEIQKINNLLKAIEKVTAGNGNSSGSENGQKVMVIDQRIVAQLQKLEESAEDLLGEIENASEDEKNALMDRYISLTEQLDKVYSKVEIESSEELAKEKPAGYVAAKAMVEQRKAENALKPKGDDDEEEDQDD